MRRESLLFDPDAVGRLAWPIFLRLTRLPLRQKLLESLEVIMKPG